MTKRILTFLFICAAVINPIIAQKELRNLRALVKAKKTSEAMKEVARLESDSTCKDMLKVYELALKTQIQINDVENEKVYLKKACDTVKLFQSTRNIFLYIHKTDSLERAQNEETGRPYKLNKGKKKNVDRYYSNLIAGTRYFYSRKNYKEAQQNLDVLFGLYESPLMDDEMLDDKTRDYTTNAYMYTYCAYQNSRYAEVERFKSTLFADERYYPSALEIYARVAKVVGDGVAFEKYLELGIERFPLNAYFFDELSALYLADERYAQSISLADQVLTADSTSLKAMYLKAHSLYKRDEQQACIEISKKLVAADKDKQYPEANYYAGAFIMNRLETIYLPTRMNSKTFNWAKNEKKKVCSEALPYLERYRKLSPSQHEKWAPLLYKAYLELNMGAEFEDISRYM